MSEGSSEASQVGAGGWRRRARSALYVAIAALYVLSIPWYRESGAQPELVLGLPDWVAFALGCYALVAVLNAVAWLLNDVHDPPHLREDGP